MSYGWALATQLAGRDSYATAVQVMCYVAAGVFLVQAALSVVRLCAPAPAAAAAAAGPPDLEALAAGGAPSKEEVGMRGEHLLVAVGVVGPGTMAGMALALAVNALAAPDGALELSAPLLCAPRPLVAVPGWLPVSNCPMPQPYPSTFYATA